jgi:hypothetical protein
MGSMLGLIATSALPQIRRYAFNFFYYMHWALFLMCSAAALYHSAKAVWWGVGIWLFDIALRAIYMAGEGALWLRSAVAGAGQSCRRGALELSRPAAVPPASGRQRVLGCALHGVAWRFHSLPPLAAAQA